MLGPSWADINLWLHILAASVWIGGQITLAAILGSLQRVSRSAGQPDGGQVVAAARSFGIVAGIAYVVLIVTGVFNIRNAGLSAVDLSSTAAGRTLGVKLILVIISGAAAGGHVVLSRMGHNSAWLRGALGGLSLVAAMAAALFGVEIAQM